MIKVYIVMQVVEHEGAEVHKVYKTSAAATAEAERMQKAEKYADIYYEVEEHDVQ